MNINRDYLIINDVKKSNVKLDNGSMFFYITDKNTQNIFVNLVINVSNNDLIQKYANIENAEDYTLTMNIVKPDNTYKIIEGKLHDKEKAIFEFDLNEDCVDEIGTYRCELLTKCNINGHEEITTSNKLTYKVKSSILNDLDDIVEAPEYPLVIQLFDKLSDINQYEEDRRANELARQLAEEQRQARFNTLDADITDRIETIDNKLVEIDNVLISKEDIADIKAKNTEQDRRLDVAENRLDNINTNIENVLQPTVQRVDAIEAINSTQNNRLDAIEAKNTQQDNRLDIAENRLANIGNDITNTMQPIIDAHTARLDAIEAIDVAQNNRLGAIENKNTEQDNRLLDIEKVNNRQDIDIKCLYGASQTIDVTKEGNSIYLQNSNNGFVTIDNIQGNTMVNCNKEPDKEIILNGNINTQGYSNVTLTEGVDGGLVDIALEGNTMVNVCDQKDPVAITKSYTVETGNHVALQGEYDGKCRPVVTGNTLVNLIPKSEIIWDGDAGFKFNYWQSTPDYIKPTNYSTDYTLIINVKQNDLGLDGVKLTGNMPGYLRSINGFNNVRFDIPHGFTGIYAQKFTTNSTGGHIVDNKISMVLNGKDIDGNILINEGKLILSDFMLLEGDYTNKPIPEYFEGLQSSFEDKVVTQEMVDAGEELAENLGKYKVDYVISREDGTVGQTKTFYLNSPLLEGDTIEQQGNNVVHVHRYGKVVLDGSNDEGYTQPNTVWGDGYSRFSIKDIPNVVNGILLSNNIICDKYPNIAQNYSYSIPSIHTGSGNICIVDSVNTLDEFRAKLQSNPVTVVYQLATPQYEVISQNDTILCDSYINGYLDVDSIVPIEKVDFLPFEEDLTYLYVNTQYAVQFVSDAVSKVDITLGGAKLLNQDVVSGINKYTITTPSELIDNNLVLNGEGFNASNIVVTPAIEQDFGYFEGMKSVGECEDLEVVSSNSDSTLSNTQTLTHEPLRAVGDIKDRYVLIDGKWYIERNCGELTVTEDIFSSNTRVYDNIKYYMFLKPSDYIGYVDNAWLEYPGLSDSEFKIGTDNSGQWGSSDKIGSIYSGASDKYWWVGVTPDTSIETVKSKLIGKHIVYQLKAPTYEPISYNPFTVYSGTTHISNNSTIPCNMVIKNTGYNCLLKPSTTYTISSNLGLNTVTTPSALTEDCLRFMDTDTSDVTTMRNVLVLEGDWTSKPDLIPSNFSGIESAFEQEYDTEKGKYKVNVKVANEDKTKENNITFYISEPLRGVGDVKDRVFIKDDKVVVERKCGSVTFDGSDDENWIMMNNNANLIRFDIEHPNVSKVAIAKELIKSNTFNYGKDENCITNHSTLSKFILFINKNKLSTQDASGFKQWLQQNPTTVVYQLAEPVYEEVEYSDVKLFIESFKNSTLFYDSNIPVTSKLYYSYSIPIVDTVAQTADISDQQDSMIIDLATQVSVMEMMLM